MPNAHLRQATTLLLESAISIAPQDSREWGLAMLSELGHVEGVWGELAWAFGCAGVLFRRTLVAILLPGHYASGLDGGFFARKFSLAKLALAASIGCLVGASLFCTSPPFRQAIHVALGPWKQIYRAQRGPEQSSLQTLARRAERTHDAEGLAFCAVRLRDPRESARLAEKAVRLDPNLLWVCAVVAVRHPELPGISIMQPAETSQSTGTKRILNGKRRWPQPLPRPNSMTIRTAYVR